MKDNQEDSHKEILKLLDTNCKDLKSVSDILGKICSNQEHLQRVIVKNLEAKLQKSKKVFVFYT